MAMEVRSDFDVTLKIRDADGRISTLGKYKAAHTEMEGEESGGRVVPHLHRFDEHRGVLASFLADSSTLELRTLNEGATGAASRVKITGLEGDVRQFRFLSQGDTPGFVVATSKDVFLVPVDLKTASTAGASVTAEATAVLASPQMVENFEPLDVRILDDGFMVRTKEERESWWYREQVYYVGVADGAVQQVDPLLPDWAGARAANITEGGDIVVAVMVHDFGALPEGAKPLGESEGQLWTFEPRLGEDARPLEQLECPDESYCSVTNWSPRAHRITYATSDGGVNVVHPGGGKDLSLSLHDDGTTYYGDAVHSLWTEPSTRRIVAGDDQQLRMWDANGAHMWTWKAPGGRKIHGSHFDHDAGGLLVTAGDTVYRVSEGKAKRVLRSRGKYNAHGLDWEPSGDEGWDDTKESFIDQALPLPGGAVAFTVVDLETTWEPADFDDGWDEEAEAEMMEMMEAEEEAEAAAAAAAAKG